MIWQDSEYGWFAAYLNENICQRRGNGIGVNTTKTAASQAWDLKRKKAFLHSNVNLSSFLLSRFIPLSGALCVFPHVLWFFFFFWFLLSGEWCLLSSPKHCMYSHISPWICSFHMAFPSPFLFHFLFVKTCLFFKMNFLFSSESLYFTLSETPWLILFLLLSPLVHRHPWKN